MLTPKSQYRYFLSLDKTVKFAAAFYAVVLLCATAVFWLRIDRLAWDLHTGRLHLPLILAGSAALAFCGLLYWVGTVTWISDVHAWLDGHFFRLLDKSNLILFEGLIAALEPAERTTALGLEAPRKESLANAVFTELANNNSLFAHLLRTGIFRLWIWYWIAMYGTFVFSILTVGSFPLVVRGADHYARTGFTICWALALVHLASGILLGRRLLRMMDGVALLVVQGHKEEIAALLRKNLSREGTAKE